MNPTTSPATPAKPNKRELERVNALEFFKRKYPSHEQTWERIYQAGGGNDEMTDFARDNEVYSANRSNAGGNHRPLLTAGADDYGAQTIQNRSIGQLIVERDEFKAFRQGGRKMASFELPGVCSFRTMQARAAVTTADVGGTIQFSGSPVFAMEQLTVADLLMPGTTDAGSVQYPRENSFVPAADTVAEGAAKPEQTFDLDPVTAGAKKIAAWTKISDELLQDSPAAQSYINARLGFAVLKAEDSQILNGDGVGSNMLGLMQTPGIQTQAKGADTIPDAIRKAIGKIDTTTDFVATGIVLHPLDWQTIELLKDANGLYIVGRVNAPLETGQIISVPALWGKPVAVSKSIAAGTALVGSFRFAAQLFRRIGMLLEMTNANEDDFKKNLLLIRAELRAALACYAPAAFCKVTGLNI